MKNSRDNLFDNIKGLLIFSVVLGHFLTGCKLKSTYSVFKWMWVVIYSYHIPVFIFVSGYFSRKHLKGEGKAHHRMLIYYCLGYVLVYLMKFVVQGRLRFHTPLIPPFAMWYFMCLFAYRLLLPWLAGIRGVCVLSLVVSLFFGNMEELGTFMTLGRLFSFLPFFLAGALLVNREMIDKLRRMSVFRKLLLTAGWLAAFCLLLYVTKKSGINYHIFWARDSYEAGKLSLSAGIFCRCVFFLSAAFSGAMMFAFMSDKNIFLTKWGRNSVSVYMLHVVIYYILQKLVRVYSLPTDNLLLLGILVVLAAAATVWLLSRDCINGALVGLVKLIERITWKGIPEDTGYRKLP